jgi:hypothetical protein
VASLQECIESDKPFYFQEKRAKGESITYYKYFKRGTGPFDDHPNCYFAASKGGVLTFIDWYYIINGKIGVSKRWRMSQKYIDFSINN